MSESTFQLPQGADRVATEELLRVLTGRPEVRALAGALPLRELAAQTVGELQAAGLPPAASRRLAAAFELGRRVASTSLEAGVFLRSSQQIFEHFHARLRDLKKERFIVVLLNGKNRIICEELVSEGILTASLVHPREVFAKAIRVHAGGMILVHNHPSGDPDPSPEDREVTRRLVAVGDLVGIRVLDHVVIGDGRYVSFLERGWMP